MFHKIIEYDYRKMQLFSGIKKNGIRDKIRIGGIMWWNKSAFFASIGTPLFLLWPKEVPLALL